MVIDLVAAAAWPAASMTRTANVHVPAVEGVPPTVLPESSRPAGRNPELIDQS
jgi:hypothetical protein